MKPTRQFQRALWASATRRAAGFTLVELLVVIAIMAVLMAIAVPSVRTMLDNTNVSRAGQTVGDQVNLARQIAAASSSTVEVRFIKLPAVSSSDYSALQIWGTLKSGTVGPLRRMVQLPQGMVVSANGLVSPAFSSSLSAPLVTGTMPMPGGGSSVAYAAFQIRPTGVALPVLAMKDFCFSVVPTRLAASGTLPANYVTIQVNPLTASPFLYRP